jgi:GT2 family glycosyltransferase
MTYHRILEPPSSLSYLVTANCIYRRAALSRVGGFNEVVKTAGGEDPGLSFALGDLGYQFAFEPGAVVRHKYRESFRDFARTFFRYGRGCRLVVDA